MKKKYKIVGALVLFALFNALVYHHARSFFFYADGDERTPPPEELTWGQKAAVLVRGIKVPKPQAHAAPPDYGLVFESIQLPGRDGILLDGWRIPQADAVTVVLLFHGYNSEKSGLLPEAKFLHAMGHEVVMVDFFGHGASPGRETSLGIHEARDVSAVLTWARSHYPAHRVVVYGHSMGGAAIMRAMSELDAVPDAAIVEAVFDTLLDAVRFRFQLLSVPAFPSAEILLFWSSVQLGVNGFDHDLTAYATNITVPVLISHGAKDNRASVAGARAVHDRLAGEKAWLLLHEAGHVNPCLSDPERWVTTVQAFLR